MKFRSLRRNFWWKFASVAASFILWMVHNGARESTTSITAPIQYRNIPKNLDISSDIVEQVHLVLRGPSPALSRLSGSQMPAIVDLSPIHSPGQTTFTIDRRNLALPPGIILERAVPAQIRVRMDERSSKPVPILARFENVPEGMRVGSVSITPDRLMIVGPKSKVDLIEVLDADPISLAGVRSPAELRTTAFSGSPLVTFQSSPSVTVRVTLLPQ